MVSNEVFGYQDHTYLPNASKMALDDITEAVSAEADVTNLIERFNTGLDIVRDKEISQFVMCSEPDCVTKGSEMFASISYDSASLKATARERSNYEKVIRFAVYAPVGAFITSFSTLYAYNSWKTRQIGRFLDMEIRENKK